MKKIVRFFTVALALVFTLTIAACKDKVNVTAQDFVKLLNLPQDRTEVGTDFTVPSTLTQSGVTVDVNWTSKNEESLKFETSEVDGSKVTTAKVTRQTEVKVAEFSANVEYNGETASKDFKVKVSKYIPDELMLAAFYGTEFEKGQEVTVNGYLGWKSAYDAQYKNYNIYVVDSTQNGGYYAFRVSSDQATYDKLNTGVAISVTGKYDVYNGAAQIGSGGKVTFRTGVEAITPTAKDITGDLVDSAINGNVAEDMLIHTGQYATFTGLKVKSVKDEIGTDTTVVISAERAGATISLAVNKYMTALTGDDAKAIAAKAGEFKEGDYVNISGWVGWYNGAIQLACQSADDIVKGEAPVLSDSEKAASVASEPLALLNSIYDVNSEVTLPQAGAVETSVTLAYALKEGSASQFKLEGNKLTITPTAEKAEATLVITATSGEKSVVKEYKMTAMTLKTDWASFKAAKDGDYVAFVGQVTHANEDKPVVLLQSADGAVYVRATGFDKLEEQFKVGTTVKVLGTKSVHNGLNQLSLSNGKGLTVVDSEVKPLPAYKDITEDVKAAKDLTDYQGMLVEVKGATYSDGKLTYKVGEETVSLAWYLDNKILPDGKLDKQMVEGGVYDVKGMICSFNGNQLNPISADAVTVVSEPVSSADATIKATVEKDGNLTDGENIASLLNLDSKLFEAYVDKGSKSNTVYAKTTGELRIYANPDDQNGNSLTIKALSNKIAKIVIDGYGDKGDTLFTVSGIEGNQTIVKDGAKLTLEFASEGVSEFTIKNINSENIQLRINSIEIYFA